MGKQLAENNKEVAKVFAKADEVLEDSLSEVIFEGPQEKLTLTTNATCIINNEFCYFDSFERV